MKTGPLSCWRNQTIEDALRNEYPLLGSISFKEKYGLNCSIAAIRNHAYKLGIRINGGIKYRKYGPMTEEQKRILSKRNKKNIFSEDDKKEICFSYQKGKSIRQISLQRKVTSYLIVNVLKEHKIYQRKRINWTEKENNILREKYFASPMEEIFSLLPKRSKHQIKKQVRKLGICRDKIKFQREGTIRFNTTNNPSWRPEVKERQRQRMKEAMKNGKHVIHFKTGKMTSLEKRIMLFLRKQKIPFHYNQVVRTKTSWRKPDFRIGKICFEADGKKAHDYRLMEDTLRDIELIDAGYTVVHFGEEQINKNWKEVERCIMLQLNQSKELVSDRR